MKTVLVCPYCKSINIIEVMSSVHSQTFKCLKCRMTFSSPERKKVIDLNNKLVDEESENHSNIREWLEEIFRNEEGR